MSVFRQAWVGWVVHVHRDVVGDDEVEGAVAERQVGGIGHQVSAVRVSLARRLREDRRDVYPGDTVSELDLQRSQNARLALFM